MQDLELGFNRAVASVEEYLGLRSYSAKHRVYARRLDLLEAHHLNGDYIRLGAPVSSAPDYVHVW